MRDHPLRVLTLASLLTAGEAAAQVAPPAAEPVRLQLTAAEPLRAGAPAAIEVWVELPAGNDAPLLLTPAVEGEAVEVVRGRLMRPDGKPAPSAGPGPRLRFEIPVLARSEGTAILRVELTTYVCERTCRRVILRASQVLRVTDP